MHQSPGRDGQSHPASIYKLPWEEVMLFLPHLTNPCPVKDAVIDLCH